MLLKTPLALIAAFIFAAPSFADDELRQLAGAMHVHSTFSSGSLDIEDLTSLAAKQGLEVLILTDHDLVAMEYGLFPFRNLLKRREERPSVLRAGAETYLAEIRNLNQRQQKVLLVPGVQSSPFYYWEGSPFRNNLNGMNYRKELLLIGMQDARDYKHLPLLHRGLSVRYVLHYLPRTLILAGVVGLSLVLCFQKGLLRLSGFTIGAFGLLLLVNHHPFQSSRFDPYHGDAGIAPYQEVIDYVRSRGGMAFWSHPESRYSAAGTHIGSVTLKTPEYADALLKSSHYSGFAALYGDTTTAELPGGHWDRVLMEYCLGKRSHPVWAIAESDFHGSKGEDPLNTFQTVFCVKEKSTAAVLEALAKGRIYAVRKNRIGPKLVLDNFTVATIDGRRKASTGAEIEIDGSPVLSVEIISSDNVSHAVVVEIIKNGKCWKRMKTKTPVRQRFPDLAPEPGRSFYRLAAKSAACGRLLSNPIFVTVKNPG